MEIDSKLIARALKQRNLPKSGLAKALGVQNSAITALLNGQRLLKAHEITAAKRFLKLDTVPLVGKVAAGAKMIFFADTGEWARVPAPEDVNENTVAVEIEGTSLGPLFDKWLVYYDRVERPLTRASLGKLCVVGLRDGAIMVKLVRPSKSKGLFHLYSNTEDPILDAEIEWAARVKSMVPR